MDEQKQYKVGEKVEDEGEYVCVPCGDKKSFTQGEQFPSCLSCLSDEEKESVAEGLELWEKAV